MLNCGSRNAISVENSVTIKFNLKSLKTHQNNWCLNDIKKYLLLEILRKKNK